LGGIEYYLAVGSLNPVRLTAMMSFDVFISDAIQPYMQRITEPGSGASSDRDFPCKERWRAVVGRHQSTSS